jgi:predicted Zn-dependent protease
MGLVFMALAGYNPEKAIDFWQKMASMGGDKPPQMLSTHPSDEKRIQDIKDFLPKIPKYLSKK